METTDSQGVADEAELCPSSRALLEASSTNMTLYYMYKFYPCGNDANTERSGGIGGPRRTPMERELRVVLLEYILVVSTTVHP